MEDEDIKESLIDYDETVEDEDDGLDTWGDEYDNDNTDEEEDY
jgi:hypothetical protein